MDCLTYTVNPCITLANYHDGDYSILITLMRRFSMSNLLTNVEKQFNEVFVSKAPYQLPTKFKEWVVEYMPIIGVVFGVIGLFATLALWRSAHLVNEVVDFSNSLSKAYGLSQNVRGLGFSYYVAIASLFVTAIIPILAYPGLKAKSKSKGWNLLFYSALISLIYGVFNAIYQGGIFSLISTLIGSAIGLYLLFQIRSFYLGKKSETPK